MHEYDKGSKWLIQHHGDAILWFAGIRDLVEWRAMHAELVQPRRFPDALLEARRAGQEKARLYIIEIATYAEPRVAEQAVRDACLVYLHQGKLPEVLVVILSRRRPRRPARSADLRSEQVWTRLQMTWRTIELWKLPAEELLQAGDVGLIPWVPLCRFDGPPAPIFRRCRERIDREAPPGERENLLVVSQILASLRYTDERLFQLFGGREAMIESPLLLKLKDEWTHEAAHEAACKSIIEFLQARFGPEAAGLRSDLDAIEDPTRLSELTRAAATCTGLKHFRSHLREATEGKP
ncbi:hypothetical protein OJF2_61260 [Aquisphaera giovannonii]|uniref:Uncharacterized protein n=1 Tax=Aquisphaera giovannonii TaxID=406548 RepID=A0A5B9WBY5_9BACT|nr:hypothetical protein [Aquisphaera giovannonii]QEH37535.1 hypothetical protein OJF2_61260 [Aquisphaera giovannonii]